RICSYRPVVPGRGAASGSHGCEILPAMILPSDLKVYRLRKFYSPVLHDVVRQPGAESHSTTKPSAEYGSGGIIGSGLLTAPSGPGKLHYSRQDLDDFRHGRLKRFDGDLSF